MDAVLTGISILGLGALLISVYVFAAAARRFVSGSATYEPGQRIHHAPRSLTDRRQNTRPVVFPITINGELIDAERRSGIDRRQHRAA
ncbi:MAG: hypothetical protein AAGI88_05660 [Pseudomonadota bacterium]